MSENEAKKDSPYIKKMKDAKLWFEVNYEADKRLEMVAEVNALFTDVDTYMTMTISELNRLQYQFSQYRMSLSEYASALVCNYNMSYNYRKNHYNGIWRGTKNAEKITNGEVDAIAEQAIWEDRCREAFMQERADLVNAVVSSIDSTLSTIRHRIREMEKEVYQKQTDNYYAKQPKGTGPQG